MSDYTLRHAIADLDRLNSWVRSESYRRSLSDGPKEAIYLMKAHAISASVAAGIASNRPIEVPVNCRRCKDGRYFDWDGCDRGACWKCDGTGKHSLKFVETRIANGPTWHSPWLKFPGPTPAESPTLVLDWKPNTPGIDMTPSEVAACLVRLERWYPGPRPEDVRYDDRRYSEYRYSPFKYLLWIGEADREKCSLCGGTDMEDAGYCCGRGRFEWRDFACRSCSTLYRDKGEIFGKFAVPRQLITPEILDWMLDHKDEDQLHGQVVHD